MAGVWGMPPDPPEAVGREILHIKAYAAKCSSAWSASPKNRSVGTDSGLIPCKESESPAIFK